MVLLSIYDGGYKASIGYNGEVFDLTNIDEKTCIYNEDYRFMKMNDLAITLSNLYEDFIKDNKWYNHKKDALKYIFSLDGDLDYIYICEDGNIEVVKRSDINVV